MDDAEPLLSVRQLVIGRGRAGSTGSNGVFVNGISFDVGRRSVLGIIGESASGKSLTALALMGLLPSTARILGGEVLFGGRDLLALSEHELRRVRGSQIAMVFQEPATALSPVHTIGWHLAAALRAAGQSASMGWFRGNERFARRRSLELLARVDLPDPEHLLDTYPHQLSAGMRRRALIALALAGRPALLIADEPTTGLDAPIQSQILDLLARLSRDEGLAIIFISHDLYALSELATDVVVMQHGQVVESGPVARVLRAPRHPYTLALLERLPAAPATPEKDPTP